jgi:tetratricopeptide (TPR) repeat protein
MQAARVFLDQVEVASAEQHWRRAAQLDRSHIESREMLVTVYERTNRAKEAIQVLEELVELQPENLLHHINLGVLHSRLEQFEAAEKAFRKAIEVVPGRIEGYVALANLFLEGNRNLSEATKMARTAVQLAPIAMHYALLGRVCEASGDYEGALTALQRATQLDPGARSYREAYERVQRQGKKPQDRDAEGAAEPSAEPAAEPAAEPSAEPAAEPAAEPSAAERQGPAGEDEPR